MFHKKVLKTNFLDYKHFSRLNNLNSQKCDNSRQLTVPMVVFIAFTKAPEGKLLKN